MKRVLLLGNARVWILMLFIDPRAGSGGALRDGSVSRDGSVASPVCHQANHLLLSRRQQTLSLGIDDPCRGCRADGFDDVPYLFRI
jgi:hypothetical protein